MKQVDFSFSNPTKLRYGENPHQKGWVMEEKTQDPLAFSKFKQIQGKQLSFNNFSDINSAVECLSFIGRKLPSCVIVKHNNPCGAGRDKDVRKAFKKAWEGDSLAAFGSIIALNRTVDGNLAKLMLCNKRFFEVLVCPSINNKAKKIFQRKKNLRILINPSLKKPTLDKTFDYKKIRGGLLVQEKDIYQLKVKDLKAVTKKKPTKKEIVDLLFAWNICRVSKANAVVLVKNQKLFGSGVGQQDRLRSCYLAVEKAGKLVTNSVAASDAFFPFCDGPKVLIKAGVKAIIQPGGSIRDRKIIDFCNRYNITMVFTGVRCFRH